MQRPTETSDGDASALSYVALRSGRIVAWWCLAEYMIHVMYMHAIQSNETYLEILPPWALSTPSFIHLSFSTLMIRRTCFHLNIFEDAKRMQMIWFALKLQWICGWLTHNTVLVLFTCFSMKIVFKVVKSQFHVDAVGFVSQVVWLWPWSSSSTSSIWCCLVFPACWPRSIKLFPRSSLAASASCTVSLGCGGRHRPTAADYVTQRFEENLIALALCCLGKADESLVSWRIKVRLRSRTSSAPSDARVELSHPLPSLAAIRATGHLCSNTAQLC